MSGTADKLEITELLYRYAELIDAGDFDGVGKLLSRATFGGTGPQGVSGAQHIAELFAATTVACSTFCVVQDTESVPIQPIVVGRYFDSFGRDSDVPGGWHFTQRKVEIQMIGNVSDHLMVDPTNF
jgi:hypothetical protein